MGIELRHWRPAQAMRIGFNARYLYDPGLRGLNRYTFSLLKALQIIPEVELHLFSEERYPVHAQYRSALRAGVTNIPAARTLIWEQFLLPRHLKHHKLDLFHAPAEGGLPARKVCPYVLTYHGVPHRSIAALVRSGELPGSFESYFDVSDNAPTGLGRALQDLRTRVLSQ